MIPTNITREHVERAIQEIERTGVPAGRDSTEWELIFNGQGYPPKYLISVANQFANGTQLAPKEVAGGEGAGSANPLLRSLRFEVVALKAEDKTELTVETVRSMFASMYADASARAAAERFVADSIEKIAAHGASRWLTSRRSPSNLVLIAGRAYAIALRRGSLRIPIDRDSIDAGSLNALKSIVTVVDEQFGSLPNTVTLVVAVANLASALQLFLPGHDRFLERAATAVRQTPYSYGHRPAVVEYLSEAVGRSLPQPKYEKVEPSSSRASRSWIFQGNPSLFDVRGALRALPDLNWVTRQHSKKIRSGDTVYFWESGADGGLVARGTVTTDPDMLPPRDEEIPFHHTDEFDSEEMAVVVHVDHLATELIKRDQLLAYPELQDLSFLQNPTGTNFQATTKQAEILRQLVDGTRPLRTVKIAPGELARYWDDCRDGGYICVGWDEVGDLSKYETWARYRVEFAKIYPPDKSAAHITTKAKELWTLRELQPGDRIVANKGTSTVVGAGEVVSGYRFRSDRPEYMHTVGVKWDLTLGGPIPSQASWGTKTVDAVADELAAQIFNPSQAKTVTVSANAYSSLRTFLEREGLYFSHEILSHYLLSLQTKRFVLLTGISGTGKTQLALGVARHFRLTETTREVQGSLPDDVVSVRVAPYMFKYRRIVLPAALRDTLEATLISKPEMRVRAGDRLWDTKVSGHGSGRSTYSLLFRKEFAVWFVENYAIGDPLHIVIREDDDGEFLEFLKPKLVEVTTDLDAFELVAVRPDWTDGRSLLGFYNPLASRYETTPTLRLLLRAGDEVELAQREQRPPRPFFLILDEMNLARVEHYFADFLSAMESGEPIHLHDRGALEPDDEESLEVPKQIRIPANLFITGTVNVDETTHMFSPKVLDRSFVIEFNEVDLEGHGSSIAGPDDLEAIGFKSLWNSEPPKSSDWAELAAIHDGQVRAAIVELHEILADENRHFGYRVANEIARYLELAGQQAGNDLQTTWTALDFAIFSKVLPKLHGTTQELRAILLKLFAFCVGQPAEVSKWKVESGQVEAVDGSAKARYPRSAAKLHRMVRRLTSRGFTSFIE